MSGELAKRSEIFTLVKTLEEEGAITPTSFSCASRPDIGVEQFTGIGVYFDYVHDGSKWWIADWGLEGEKRFGEEFPQLAAALRRDERTILNWMYVAQRVPRSRRRESLSFTHHTLVAPLEPADQDAWLDLAESEGWSSRDLKAAIDASRQIEPAAGHDTESAVCPCCGGPVE
jgi:hypothetical protein